MQDLISVIVPVYNVAPYISECLDSICKQTYPHLEIILVDDGSKDQSGAICDEYAKQDARICVIHKQNGGLSSARNAGLDCANGQYIGFVDSDDWIEPDMYENLLHALKNSGAQIACCGHTYIMPENRKRPFGIDQYTEFSAEEAFKRILLDEGMSIAVWDKLYPCSLWKELRFPLNETNEDAAVLPNLISSVSKIIHIGKPKYNYRLREGSITREFNPSYMAALDHNERILSYTQENFPHLMYAARYYHQRIVMGLLSVILYAKKKNARYYKRVKKLFNAEFGSFVISPLLSARERMSALLMYFNLYAPLRTALYRLNLIKWVQSIG